MFQGKRGPLVAGAIVVALAILFIVLLLLPKMSQVSSAREELLAAEAQTSTLESQLAALEQAELAAPENRATIQEVEQQIPPTLDQGSYLLLIKNAALQSGVGITTLTPGVPVFDAVTGLSSAPVAITADGTYFSIAEFMYSLETLPRAAKVGDLTLAPSTGGPDASGVVTTNELQMTTTVTLFTSDASAGPGSEPGANDTAEGG